MQKKESVKMSNGGLFWIAMVANFDRLLDMTRWGYWFFALPLFLLILVPYYCCLRPAGMFDKFTYFYMNDSVEIKKPFKKQSKVYILKEAKYLYVYRTVIPQLIISEEPIADKKEARQKIKAGEVGCVTLWGPLRTALSSYEKSSPKLK